MAIREQFSSRWGLILAALGMAIGTGNIWRFPREAAKHGGGAFLIAWIVALFVWSIPLLMVEFAIGKSTRRGTIGAFAKFLGPGHAWMGAFIGFCTLAILFYYSVVTGWCLKYFVATVIEPSTLQADPETYWKSFTNSSWSVFWSEERSLQPIIYHGLAILAGAAIVAAGVVKGIQRANRIFIPALFILLIIAAIRACTLDGASRGIEYLFHIDIAHLKNYETWLAAFSQSAWSTGAGWGLILTYAVYTREKEDVALNSFLTGLGNNSASLIAALAVIPVVFALLPQEEALAVMKQGNEGMTFTWLPQLFLGGQMPGGRFFLPLFFLALSVAALSSLIALVELGARILMDMGLSRKKAIMAIGVATFGLGLPSACSMSFFQNQDWVWGVGLLISGVFCAYAAIRYGVDKFRRELLNAEGSDMRVGRWFNVAICFLIPAAFLGMIIWWFGSVWPTETLLDGTSVKLSFADGIGKWLAPFEIWNVGTCLFQWTIAILIFIALGRLLARLSLRGETAK